MAIASSNAFQCAERRRIGISISNRRPRPRPPHSRKGLQPPHSKPESVPRRQRRSPRPQLARSAPETDQLARLLTRFSPFESSTHHSSLVPVLDRNRCFATAPPATTARAARSPRSRRPCCAGGTLLPRTKRQSNGSQSDWPKRTQGSDPVDNEFAVDVKSRRAGIRRPAASDQTWALGARRFLADGRVEAVVHRASRSGVVLRDSLTRLALLTALNTVTERDGAVRRTRNWPKPTISSRYTRCCQRQACPDRSSLGSTLLGRACHRSRCAYRGTVVAVDMLRGLTQRGRRVHARATRPRSASSHGGWEDVARVE